MKIKQKSLRNSHEQSQFIKKKKLLWLLFSWILLFFIFLYFLDFTSFNNLLTTARIGGPGARLGLHAGHLVWSTRCGFGFVPWHNGSAWLGSAWVRPDQVVLVQKQIGRGPTLSRVWIESCLGRVSVKELGPGLVLPNEVDQFGSFLIRFDPSPVRI